MARDAASLLEQWQALRIEGVVDDDSLLRFVCAPRELAEYRAAFIARGDLGHEATVGDVYRERLRWVAEAARRGLLVDGKLGPAGSHWGPRRAQSVASVIGADLEDVDFLWQMFGDKAERFKIGALEESGLTRWVEPKELVPHWTVDVLDPEQTEYMDFRAGGPRAPRYRHLVEHLLELDESSIAVSPAEHKDGYTSIVRIDFDRHDAGLLAEAGPRGELLRLPDGRFLPAPTDERTADRVELVTNAFKSRPVALVTSPRGLQGYWVAPGSAPPAWFAEWAERQIVEYGGELRPGAIEVLCEGRVPFGIGSRLVDGWFQPLFPLSWKTKGQELRAFRKAIEAGPVIPEDLLAVDLREQRHVSLMNRRRNERGRSRSGTCQRV